MAILLQRFNNQIIHWHPHRAAPVRVTPKHRDRAVGRTIAKDLGLAALRVAIGCLTVDLRKGANTMGRQELILIKKPFTDPS